MAEIIAALSWPHFGFAFALVFLVLFRKQVIQAFGRRQAVHKGGVEALHNPEVQRENPNQPEAAQELLLAMSNSLVLKEVESRIANELLGRNLVVEGETTRVLIKHLAAVQIALEFEKIHNRIFASQLVLLKKLNEVAGLGQSRVTIQSYFEQVKKRNPQVLAAWSAAQYLEFLVNRSLIAAKSDSVHITNIGKEYLLWVARTGQSEGKNSL